MTDYLNSDDGTGGDGDYLGGGGSYLDLDDPAMPTGAPAPPTDPFGSSTAGGEHAGGYLDGGSGNFGGFLDTGSADHGGHLGETTTNDNAWINPGSAATEPVAEPIFGYFADAVAASPDAAAPAPAPLSYASPSPIAGELSIEAPMLEEVYANAINTSGARGDLSSLVLDVEVQVEVYFGDASLTVEQFLEMGRGTVLELDHSIEAPIELRVKGRRVATGQLVTINGNYGLRILDMEGRD